MLNTCSIKYDRHGTTLEFEHDLDSEKDSILWVKLAVAGFRQSNYTVRNAITLEIESYHPYWYVGYSMDPGEVAYLVGMPVTGGYDD